MTRILIAHKKHDTLYYEATSDEQLAKSALHLLRQNYAAGYYTFRTHDDPDIRRAAMVTDEEIALLRAAGPTGERAASNAEYCRDNAQRAVRETEAENAQVALIDSLLTIPVEEAITRVEVVGRKNPRSVPLAWRLLESRSDYEYEDVELREVLEV